MRSCRCLKAGLTVFLTPPPLQPLTGTTHVLAGSIASEWLHQQVIFPFKRDQAGVFA
jgi:hypothetical protein